MQGSLARSLLLAPGPLAVGLLIGTLILTSQAQGQEHGVCLPPRAGETLAALLQGPELHEKFGGRVEVRRAAIEGDRIRLELGPAGSGKLELELLPLQASGIEPCGRWFGYRLPADATPEQADLGGEVARWVDGHYPDDPWVKCNPAGGTQASGGSGLRIPTGCVSWFVAAILALLLGLGVRNDRACAAGRWIATWLDRTAWYWLGALLLGMAVARLAHLDIALDADYTTQRLFFGSLDWGDILAHRYEDQRHPQLFYLILHAFLWIGHEPWVVRLPAAIFSLTTAVALFVLARRYLGEARALGCVLVLSLSTAFLFHSRDVSDVTLFLTLAILAWDAFLRCAERLTLGRAVYLALAEIGMLYSYYMGVLVLAAQVGALAWAALRGPAHPRRGLWATMGLVMLACVPFWIDFGNLIRADLATRQVAAAYPQHLWGERQAGEFGVDVLRQLFPAGLGMVPAALAAALGLWRWLRAFRRQPAGRLMVCLLVMAALVIGLGVSLVRMKPYYVIYLLPLVALWIACGVLGFPAGSGPVPGQGARWPAAARGVLGLACLAGLVSTYQAEAWVNYQRDSHAAYAKLGEYVRAHGGADLVVADPDSMHTILLYYLFPGPLEAYRTCRRSAALPVRCTHQGHELVNLTSMPRLKAGWEAASLERFRGLRRPLWFVHSSRFSNPALEAELASTCELQATFDHLRLLRCPVSTQGRPPGTTAGDSAGPEGLAR